MSSGAGALERSEPRLAIRTLEGVVNGRHYVGSADGRVDLGLSSPRDELSARQLFGRTAMHEPRAISRASSRARLRILRGFVENTAARRLVDTDSQCQ